MQVLTHFLIRSCRALVLLLPPEPNRRRVLSEAMMALSHAGRTFVDAAGLPESTGTVPLTKRRG